MTEVHPTKEACLEAIDRISRTPDGALLYVLLQRRLMVVLPSPERGALRSDQGERKFAAQLIAAMHKGILESGGRTGITGSSIGPSGAEQPVVVPYRKPVDLRDSRPRGTGRRIDPDDRSTGYDRDDG